MTRGRAAAVRAASLPIGEEDANIVDCPVCKRPLDANARRCPGCRTLLVWGIQASKASVFTATGLALGLLVGGGTVALITPRQAAVPIQVPVPTAPPVATAPAPSVTTAPLPSASVIAPSAAPTIPSAAAAALRGSATVNGRIALSAVGLSSAIGASQFDAQEVARIMRRLSFDAGAAEALLPSLSEWPEAATVQAELAAFYEGVRSTASDTLGSSVRDVRAYKDGARKLLTVLGRLGALDQASRELATSAGLELPALPVPG
jgi:hypothetical protein